jgi:hypothetical protein
MLQVRNRHQGWDQTPVQGASCPLHTAACRLLTARCLLYTELFLLFDEFHCEMLQGWA